MTRAIRFALILVTFAFLTGCHGLESAMKKSAMKSALPTDTIDDHQLSLAAKLAQQPNENKKGFDLIGSLEISAQKDGFPTNCPVPTFSLRPCWRGYDVMCFANNGGQWELPSTSGADPNFTGTSQITNGIYLIQFTWRNQGLGRGEKSEHFAAYDVAVTIEDSQKKRHLLSQLNVATK